MYCCENLRHLSIVPDDIAHHVGPVCLVNHQTVDPVVVGLVVLEPHAAMLVGVGVPGHIDPGPIDNVGLGFGAIIRPRGILSIHSAVIEEGNEVSVVINFISLQKYFGPERISETSLRRQKCDVSLLLDVVNVRGLGYDHS